MGIYPIPVVIIISIWTTVITIFPENTITIICPIETIIYQITIVEQNGIALIIGADIGVFV